MGQTSVRSGTGFPTQQGDHPFCYSLWSLLTKKLLSIFLSGFFFLRDQGGCSLFHGFFFVLSYFCHPLPDTIPPASHQSFMCIFSCVPHVSHGLHVFLMYPLTSRHLYMLITIKADVLKYSCSRVNVHKLLRDYWWVCLSACSSLVRKPSTRLLVLLNSLCRYLDYS